MTYYVTYALGLIVGVLVSRLFTKKKKPQGFISVMYEDDIYQGVALSTVKPISSFDVHDTITLDIVRFDSNSRE